MKRVRFDEKLEHLVDEEGNKYHGKRFYTASVGSSWHSTYKDAEDGAIFDLEELAQDMGAEAFEVIEVRFEDSKQEYDSSPYSASISALLYKKQD